MMQTVVSQTVAKAFPSVSHQNTVEEAIQKCQAEPHTVIDVPTHAIYFQEFTVPATKLVKNDAVKRAILKIKLYQNQIVSNNEVLDDSKKEDSKFPSQKIDLVISEVPRRMFWR